MCILYELLCHYNLVVIKIETRVQQRYGKQHSPIFSTFCITLKLLTYQIAAEAFLFPFNPNIAYITKFLREKVFY